MSTEPQVSYGYQIEQENFGGILQYGLEQYHRFRASFDEYQWEPPKEIDPRDWFDIEDQSRSNSCVGNSDADIGEWLAMLADGQEIQLSRYFAYLASQDMGGGMRGDNGAYLEASTRANARGIPLESRFPWSINYNAQRNKYRAELSDILAGDVWKYPGGLPLGSFEDSFRFLSGFTGGIHIGIPWTNALRNVGKSGEIKSYSPRGAVGGHALLWCGYVHVSGWGDRDCGILMKNSHSKNWGNNGWGIVHPDAVNAMCRAGTIIGRSDLVSPRPRREAIDNFRARYKQGSGRTIGGPATAL